MQCWCTVTLPTVIGPAILEELQYRGILQGFLLRLCKDNRVAVTAATICVSLLWALLHLPNTNAPLLKCIQVFIIGLVLSEFARRKGIGTSIAAHVSLNISATILELILKM
jgi:membrane protease YdiL (CAAX protease family)